MISEDQVRAIIVEGLGVAADAVTLDASFVEDLGADSLDALLLIMAFEIELGIEVADQEAEKIRTVRDALHYLQRGYAESGTSSSSSSAAATVRQSDRMTE